MKYRYFVFTAVMSKDLDPSPPTVDGNVNYLIYSVKEEGKHSKVVHGGMEIAYDEDIFEASLRLGLKLTSLKGMTSPEYSDYKRVWKDQDLKYQLCTGLSLPKVADRHAMWERLCRRPYPVVRTLVRPKVFKAPRPIKRTNNS